MDVGEEIACSYTFSSLYNKRYVLQFSYRGDCGMEKSIVRLLKDIAQENVDLTVEYDEKKDDLIFACDVNGEECKQILRHSDTEACEDQNLLITYVLAEMLSVIRGLKEEAQTE